MGYLHSDRLHGDNIPCDGRGEVWVRGSGVINGYFKDEEETEAAGLKNANGWLKSGDIGKYLLFYLLCYLTSTLLLPSLLLFLLLYFYTMCYLTFLYDFISFYYVRKLV